ncbi:MAG: 2-oxoacid:acceptor oxidoreductase family protein [Rubritepida sp.]|nr:2-oxoacid:acceptor oxidoreductase family protein [Rubritepida sp.]
MINPRVCEDCGDCSRTSNCTAVEPIETEFGRKRRIDQSNCNQDFSCVDGFCPSFVSLIGAEPARPPAPTATAPPDEPLRVTQTDPWNLVIAGVGGQGVTALSAILAMAAHLEERPVRSVDALGLAQKGGGVYAQLRVGLPNGDALMSPRIGAGQADLMIAADLVVAHGRFARPLLSPGRSVAVLSEGVAPTAEFVLNPETRLDGEGMRASLEAACRQVVALPGARAVEDRFGDLIYLNVWLLGVAYQRGLVQLGSAAILRALELNGIEIARNQAAFNAGRHAALAPERVQAAETPAALIARRVTDLTAYQGRRYAARYEAFIARVAAVGSDRLTRAVATQLYRLMAYKDEYEVARLHSLPEWQAQLRDRFTGTTRIELHLAPPFMGGKKRAFGPWMLRAMGWLRHGRVLRGTVLDPFGYAEERRVEAALPGEYMAGLEALLPWMATHHDTVCEWAEAAGGIKGYGHIKARNLAAARTRMDALRDSVTMPHVRAA